MKTKKLFFVLAVAAITLVAGCATGKNEKVKGVVTVGKPYIVREFILPQQKVEPLSFVVFKARNSEDFAKDGFLVPAFAVGPYMEILAKVGQIPLRVKEGFLTKEKGRWLLLQTLPDEVHVIPFDEYYFISMTAVR